MRRLLVVTITGTILVAANTDCTAQVRRKTVRTTRRPVRRRPPRRPGRTIQVRGRKTVDSYTQRTRKEAAEELKRLNRDLIYWKKLLSGTPAARQKEKALYHVGLLSLKTKRVKPAEMAFEMLVKKFPKGPWLIAAKMHLAVLKLEHARDLKAANALVTQELKWADAKSRALFPNHKRKKKKIGKTPKSVGTKPKAQVATSKPKTALRSPSPANNKVPSFVREPNTEKLNVAVVYRTAGILAFIQGKMGTTRFYLMRYRALHGPPKKRPTPEDMAQQRVYMASVTRRGFTPLVVWTSRKPNFPYICYGDVLYESGDYDRALAYVAALTQQNTMKFTSLQRSYLYYLRGRCLNAVRDHKQRQKAAVDFLAAHRLAPKSRWADDCLYLAANASWNHERNAEKAIRYWRQLQKEYPKSIEADRSAFYVGVVYQQTKRYRAAKAAYEMLLKDRPKSAFAKLAEDELKKVHRELSRGRR